MEGFFVTFLLLEVTSFDLYASPEGKPSNTDTLVAPFFIFFFFFFYCAHI